MATRTADKITIHGERGVLDRFDGVAFSASLAGPAIAKLAMGDSGSWDDVKDFIRPGYEYQVRLNDRPVLKGRVEALEVPTEGGSGTRYELQVKTKLSDARYASADPDVKTSNTTIKDFLLALFKPHGFTESDFVLDPLTSADLITGVPKGSGKKAAIESITAQDAKVQPPETVWEAAARHLERHALMLWDSPDGKICVGAPDDEREPSYRLTCKRGAEAKRNNVTSIRRIENWSELASGVTLLGQSTGKEGSKRPIRASAFDVEVQRIAEQTGHFFRPVFFPAERIKTRQEAERKAMRDLSARRRQKDAWEITIDGWTVWDGQRATPIAINTTADIECDAPEIRGRYMVWRLECRMTKGAGADTSVGLVGPGAWIL